MNNFSLLGKRKFAVVDPKRVDDLKPGFTELIGKKLEFEYFGTGNDDEAYPGENRWGIVPGQKGITDEVHGWMWMPECDLNFINLREDS